MNEKLRYVTYLKNCTFLETSCWAVNFSKVYMKLNKWIFFLVKGWSCSSFPLKIQSFEKVIKFWIFLILHYVTYTRMLRNVQLGFSALKSLRQEKKWRVWHWKKYKYLNLLAWDNWQKMLFGVGRGRGGFGRGVFG